MSRNFNCGRRRADINDSPFFYRRFSFEFPENGSDVATFTDFAVRSPRSASRLDRGPTEALPTLDGWQPIRLVAETRLSRVFQARGGDSDPKIGAPYAIKLLAPEWEASDAAIKLFQREAAVGQAVSDPHLVAVLASQVAHPPRYLVMPWLEGESLADCALSAKRLSIAHAVWYARQIAEALAALDRAGWVHGDVKPANILVSAEGHATLIDLGFARGKGEPAGGPDRALLGTPAYLAPEALLRDSRADIRADIYSLGVTLYEVLIGRLPPGLNGPLELQSALRQAAGKVRGSDPLIPRSICQLLQAMLAGDPLRRPQSPAELIELLVAIEIEALSDRFARDDSGFNPAAAGPLFLGQTRSGPVPAHIPG